MPDAYKYIMRAGGLVSEASYPYSAATFNGSPGTCQLRSGATKFTLTGYTQIAGEAAMYAHVASSGPLSVAVSADAFQTYTGGVLLASQCTGSLNHAVQVPLKPNP